MSTGVGDIFLDLKLNKQPFEKGLTDVKSTAGIAGKKIGLALAGAITSVVGTVAFSALISQAAKLGDAIDKTSQKVGMSAQTYQQWDYIMQRCGTSMESMTMAMKTLASSAETSKDALSELGISQAEVASLSQEELFSRTISALQQVSDTTRRTYLAGQLLGRGATELGGVLNLTSQQTDQLRQRFSDLGGMMSQQAVSNAAAYEDAITDIKMAFRGISNTIAESVLPVITQAFNSVIIPIILKASAVLRYFVNIWNSVFGAIRKKASALGGIFGKVGNGIKSVFGKAAQKQNIKMSKSLGGVSKGIGSAGKSAKKTKKAIKELNRELMGFDKMNKLAKKNKDANTGGGGSKGAGGGGGVDMGGVDDALGDVDNKLFDMSKLGEKLAPIWKALGGVFKAILRLFKAIGKALAPVGKWVWNHLIKPFGKLLSMAIVAVLEGIAGAIELVASIIEKHPKLAVTILGIAGAFLAFKNATKIMFAFGKTLGILFKFIGGFNPFVLGLTAVAIAIGYIYKNWDKIKKTKFGKTLIKVATILKKVGQIIGKSVVLKFKSLVKIVRKVISAFKTIGGYLTNAFKRTLDKVSKNIQKFKETWDALKNRKVAITAKLKGVKEKTVKNLKKAFDALPTKKVATLTAKLKNNINMKVIDKLKSAWAKIKTTTADLKVNLKATIAKGYNAAAKKINGLINKLPKVVRPSWRLPYLAQGGFVGKNTPQLAVVGDNKHEGEIVSPESKLEAMARKVAQETNGSDERVVALLTQLLAAVRGIDTNVYLDGNKIADNTVKRINQQTRTTGVSPLLV